MIKTLLPFVAVAAILLSCGQTENKPATQNKNNPDSLTASTSQQTNTVDLDQAMDSIPRFSSTETQKFVDEYVGFLKNSFKELQNSNINGDPEKAKALAMEQYKKYEPWKAKVQAAIAAMSPADKALWNSYSEKMARKLVVTQPVQ